MIDARGGGKREDRKSYMEKLGFKDPDLKCPEHDRMSFAMADPEFMMQLCYEAWSTWPKGGPQISEIECTLISLEHPIVKGDGQYKIIIGYVDAVAQIGYVETWSDGSRGKRSRLIVVEAKPRLENPMETLRQIKTYREFFESREPAFLLWCPEISDSQARIFAGQNILVSEIPVPAA